MAKKQSRRVKVGELSYADLRSDGTVYAVGLSDYYNDIETFTNAYGTFEKGVPMRKNARNALIAKLLESEITNRSYGSWLDGQGADELYKFLVDVENIGHKTAILFTLAMKGELPSLKWTVALQIHDSIFVAPASPTLERIRGKYAGEYDSKVLVSRVYECAAEMFGVLVNDLHLKNPPTMDEVLEIVFDESSTWTDESGVYCMDMEMKNTEESLLKLAKEECDLPYYMDDYTKSNLAPDQEAAMDSIFRGPRLTMLDGIPGSGKSHEICALYRTMLRHEGPGSMLITSYTNKACVVLNERIPEYEFARRSGIRSLLSIYNSSLSNAKFVAALKNVKVLCCDESSMNSTRVMHYLLVVLSKCSPGCKLLLVGDENQLPPVAEYGRPFSQLCRVKDMFDIHVIGLSTFRRSNAEGIYFAFADMRNGGLHTVNYYNNQVELVKAKTMELAVDKVSNAYAHDVERDDSVTVVAETNALCDAINLATARKIFGDNLDFNKYGEGANNVLPNKVGMRLVCTANLRDNRGNVLVAKNEFVDLLETGIETFRMSRRSAGGAEVCLPVDMVYTSFKLGFCCTVHKYQGSEEDTVYYVFDSDQNMHGSAFSCMKELKYVAFSRARKTLRVIAVCSDIAKDYEVARTGLPVRLVDSATPNMYISDVTTMEA